jgi:alpha-beta hydrolase superfamily lysophospholipase
MSDPDLQWFREPADPRAVVIVLHGGTPDSRDPVSRYGLPVMRLVPFAWSLGRARRDVAVALLRYAVRGWNGTARSPVADARWALEQVADRFPGRPVALVGHSMGGRTALHVMDDPSVQVVATLATWVERRDPVHGRPGLSVFLGHGTDDRITAARGSSLMARALEAKGADVTLELVDGENHALLRRPRWWHERVTAYVMGELDRLTRHE